MPATLEIAVGQTGAVTVVLDGAQEAYGIDVRGTFDPNVIELVPASPSSPLTAGGFIKPDFIVRNTVDNVAGTFQWAATQMNPSAPASGSGPILIAQARGKTAGRSTSIEITSVELSDRSGSALPVTRRAGTVKVLGSEGAGTSVAPTSTPTPLSKGLLTESTPTPSPIPAPTSTRAATPTGQASSTTPTRTVLNVTAQPVATAGAPAAPRATIEPTPPPTAAPETSRAPATPGTPATPGAPATPATPGATAPPAGTVASSAITATRSGANAVPTFTPEALAAVAQSGLAPKAPAALPPGGAAAPGTATPPAAPGSPDPIMGFVLLAIGLAGVYGFGAADRQHRRRSK